MLHVSWHDKLIKPQSSMKFNVTWTIKFQICWSQPKPGTKCPKIPGKTQLAVIIPISNLPRRPQISFENMSSKAFEKYKTPTKGILSAGFTYM